MPLGSVKHWAGVQAELGESPVWDARTATLYFVDIARGRIHALDGHAVLHTLYHSSRPIGALALTQAEDLLFAEGARLAVLDRQTWQVSHVSRSVSAEPNRRFNDGACDPRGRFVTGLMDEHHGPESGRLYRFDSRLSSTPVHDGMGLPNGLAWSRRGERLYFVDSVARKILQADYDVASGALDNIMTFVETPEPLGRPDGLAMDVEGGLWVCQFGGGCLLRFDACGELTDRLEMPVPRPTSSCFGGADMKTLFITSARFGLRPDECECYPASGDVFAVHLPVAGLERHRFTNK